jgi:uncharacterized protein (DUF58 family)
MTRRGLAVLASAVLAWAVGRLLGIDEFLVIAVAAAVVVAGSLAAVAFAGAGVAVRRRVSRRRLPAGASARVTLELRNTSRLPVPILLGEDRCERALLAAANHARFVVPGLSRGAGVPADYVVTGRLRGRYTVGPLTLRIRDPFGLAERVRRYRATDELVVYPAIEELPRGLALGRHHGSGASQSRRLFNTGDEFHTMREYLDGDDLRHVHWRSTAHRQTLMVRQNEQPWDTEATVLCDTRSAVHHGSGAGSSLERAVSAAASVVWHLEAEGYRLRFFTEADVRPPRVTTRDACLDRLAVLEPTRGRELTPLLTRLRSANAEGLLVAILAAAPETDVDAHMRALLQVGRTYSGRIAILLDTGAPGSARRAAQLAGMLDAAGWRTGTQAPGVRLAAVWREIAAGRRAQPTAYRPDAAAPAAVPGGRGRDR